MDQGSGERLLKPYMVPCFLLATYEGGWAIFGGPLYSGRMSLLGTKEGLRSDWFPEGVVLKVGNDTTTSFWLDS